MTVKARRARYSVLFWPSLYPTSAFLILFAGFLFVAGLVTALQYLSGTNERMLHARASERARSAAALKLSGVEKWQWQNDLSCIDRMSDCLPMRWSFRKNAQQSGYTLRLKAEQACAICHAAEFRHEKYYYVNFPGERNPVSFSVTPVINFSAAVLLAALASFMVLWMKYRRSRAGVVVAALEGSSAAPLLPGIRGAYFREISGDRVRWAGAAEDFADYLVMHAEWLKKNAATLRLVAVHVDLKTHAPLAIETMRGVFRLLAQTQRGQFLVQEPLLTQVAEKTINMRRLVFKNKSGASLKFISWEP